MDKYYTLQDIERLFKKTRTTALKMAQNKGWIVIKEKVDKVYKNLYLKEEVDRELGIIAGEKKLRLELGQLERVKQRILMNYLTGIKEWLIQDMYFA